MTQEKVMICCDCEERALAEILRTIISTLFEDLEVNLCIDGPVASPDPGDPKTGQRVLEKPAAFGRPSPDATKWSDQFSTDSEYRSIFFLCSPYSITRKWINFISGVATLFVSKGMDAREDEIARIIPLCHSGQKSNDLPHYLMSRQALELENDRFIDSLIAVLTPRSLPRSLPRRFDLSEFKKEEFQSGEARDLCAAIASLYPDEATGEDPVAWLNEKLENPVLYERLKLGIEEYHKLQADYEKHKRLKDLKELNRRHLEMLYGAPKRKETPQSLRKKVEDGLKDLAKPVIFSGQSKHKPVVDKRQRTYKLVDEAGTVTISILEEGDSERAPTNQMIDFLDQKVDTVKGVGISAGVQNCLYDGEGIYVGVRIVARVDLQFRSFCESKKSLFEPGYGVWPDSGGTIQDLFVTEDKFEKKYIAADQRVRQIIEERVKAVGGKLWTIRLPGSEGTAAATIFANTSTNVPRYEIGVWQFINIEGLTHEGEKQIPDFGADRDSVGNDEIVYWIWVRNGRISYWSFPDGEDIPRRYPVGGEPGLRKVLVPFGCMKRVYGRPEEFTPFAPDELLRSGYVVKEYFSEAARVLLSIF